MIEKIKFLTSLIFEPIIFSGFIATFLAWMAAMTKFELSHAYPFMSLNYIVFLLLSGWLFREPLTILKVVSWVNCLRHGGCPGLIA
jgi:multidrug transporter EmrE-like cation transporter